VEAPTILAALSDARAEPLPAGSDVVDPFGRRLAAWEQVTAEWQRSLRESLVVAHLEQR
jgi:hypothetical protein